MSHEIYRMIRLLEREGMHCCLHRHREDSILMTATLVGERIEIDVFEDVEDNIPLLEALLREHGKE